MVLKLKIKLDRTSLKKVIDQKKKLISHNIEQVFLNEALPHLIDLIMIGYDSLSDRMGSMPEDPTSPSHWREEFLARLHEDAYETISVKHSSDTDIIKVQIGDKDFLGYGQEDDKSDSPLIWLVYYLEGLAGEWGFISKEMAGSSPARLGRFGDGFLISREAYENEGWQARTGISFNEIRHPFSAYSPLDIFRVAIEEFKLKPFVTKAVQAAIKGDKL